jgi:uncharacterized protein
MPGPRHLAALSLFSGLLFLSACAPTPPQITVNVPPPPTADSTPVTGGLVVDGQAKLSLRPDCLDLLLTLSAEDPRADRAVAEVNRRQKTFLEAIKPLGLEAGDLALGLVSLVPLSQYNSTTHRYVLYGYRAEIQIVATLHDFGRIGELAQHAASAGADSMSTRFRSTELTKYKARVREMALKAAREKAEHTASALGITLGPVISVREISTSNSWQTYGQVANSVAFEDGTQDAPLQAETQDLSLTIEVSYSLGSKT